MIEIKIGNIVIKEGGNPYIIAEAGVNYENDLDVAKEMVKEAASAGADAIKFQTYKAETLAAKDSPAYWDTDQTQRDFFKRYDSFGAEEYIELAKEAEKRNIVFMSTPFDDEAVDFLDTLMPAYKIASADITNVPFLRHIAEKNKPILLSTGASTIEEIENAIAEIKKIGDIPIVPLHCILSYPTSYEDANLNMITHLKTVFPKHLIGYSDHTKPDRGMSILVTAYLLGATILEKHFTLDKTLPGNDHYHAMDPEDLKLLNENLDIISRSLGSKQKHVIDAEKPARANARRSLVTVRSMGAGTILTEADIITKRPGKGISPLYYDSVIGMKLLKDIDEDEIIYWEYLKEE